MGKQALVTDLGNVLVTFWERSELVKVITAGFKDRDQKFHGPFFNGQGEDVYDAIDTGSMDMVTFHEKICQASGIRLSYERFLMLWARHLEIIKPVAELYRGIQKKTPIIVVSNGDIGSFHAADLLRVYAGIKFYEVFVSSDRRLKKPGLFGQVVVYLKSHGFDPGICPYVDDIQKYVWSARQYGLGGIVFNGREQSVDVLKQSLAQFGIV